MTAATAPHRIYLEVGSKWVFALALDWPGWARGGRDAETALAALAAAGPRYAEVARTARIGFDPGGRFEIVERVTGSATTDFGAPGSAAAADLTPMSQAEADRIATLVAACWKVLDDVSAGSSEELRKGPRGGGRARDQMLGHVLDAEAAYLAKLGIRGLKPPAVGDREATAAQREAILAHLRATAGPQAVVEKRWLPRYAARRIAWHVLDHAWEMEDRRP